MVIHPLFNRTLLVLLMTVYVAQATVVQTFYKIVNSGENITGQGGQKVTSLSVRECSVRLVNFIRN